MKTLPPLSVINFPAAPTPATGAGPKPGQASQLPGQWALGETLRAVVVEARANNQFILESGANRFLVQSQTPLAAGQPLDLQVVSTQPNLELRIMHESLAQLFGRSLATSGSNQDLSSFFSVLQQTPGAQLQGLSSAGLENLRQFATLQQQSIPAQGGSSAAAPAVNQADFGQKILQQFFDQLGVRLNDLLAQHKGPAAQVAAKTALADLALLFHPQDQLSQQTLRQIETLSTSAKGVFEIIATLQQPGGRDQENTLNRLLQQLQLQPNNLFPKGNATAFLSTLKTTFSELGLLLKEPAGMLQLISGNSLRSGLLSTTHINSALAAATASAASGNKGGEQLQQLVNRLGLNLEQMLATGNREGAVNTVKFGLMELVQNLPGFSKLAESGAQALNSLEFAQLAQLQLDRQDTFILPLPLPFLNQGFLLVENYRHQAEKNRRDGETKMSFSLLLKLSPLGNLRIDFIHSGNGFYVRFHSSSKDVSEFLASSKGELSEALGDTPIHGISFSEDGEEPLTSLVKESGMGNRSIFTTKA